MIQSFALALCVVAALRLTDIVWPPKLLPWQVYATEMGVALVLMFLFPK